MQGILPISKITLNQKSLNSGKKVSEQQYPHGQLNSCHPYATPQMIPFPISMSKLTPCCLVFHKTNNFVL